MPTFSCWRSRSRRLQGWRERATGAMSQSIKSERPKRRDRQPADLMALLVLSEMLADDPPLGDLLLPDQIDMRATTQLPARKL